VSAGLPLLIALVPLAIVLVVVVKPFYPWNTRTVPARMLGGGIGVLFAASVLPPLGWLAAMGLAWWWVRGFHLATGGVLWPTAAMGIWLGLQAPGWAHHWALAFLLAGGVFQTLLVSLNAARVQVLYSGMLAGTIGHRTGVGIYLGLLTPLAFLSPYPWPLITVYVVGLVISRSLVGWVTAAVGLLWVQPHLWGPVVIMVILGAIHRFMKWNEGHPKERICSDAWKARFAVWQGAFRAIQVWPYWFVGRGADSFHVDGRRWTSKGGFSEEYKEAHNDYVEFIYEYGVLGVAGILWLAWYMAPGLRWGDPVTGAMLGFAAASLGNFPVRVAPIVGILLLLVIWLLQRA
jgi:hypothetical protein